MSDQGDNATAIRGIRSRLDTLAVIFKNQWLTRAFRDKSYNNKIGKDFCDSMSRFGKRERS
jgi:hypothetical protein